MQFRWAVGDGLRLAEVELRDGFVPEIFYELLDRLGTAGERSGDAALLAELKQRLAAEIWREPLARLFRAGVLKMERAALRRQETETE